MRKPRVAGVIAGIEERSVIENGGWGLGAGGWFLLLIPSPQPPTPNTCPNQGIAWSGYRRHRCAGHVRRASFVALGRCGPGRKARAAFLPPPGSPAPPAGQTDH